MCTEDLGAPLLDKRKVSPFLKEETAVQLPSTALRWGRMAHRAP